MISKHSRLRSTFYNNLPACETTYQVHLCVGEITWHKLVASWVREIVGFHWLVTINNKSPQSWSHTCICSASQAHDTVTQLRLRSPGLAMCRARKATYCDLLMRSTGPSHIQLAGAVNIIVVNLLHDKSHKLMQQEKVQDNHRVGVISSVKTAAWL